MSVSDRAGIGRRTVLKAGAAALAAPWLAHAAGCAAAPRRPLRVQRDPNAAITLGLIGMGIQNRYHLDAFMKNPGARVLAVCDVDTTRREDAKARADAHYGGGGGELGLRGVRGLPRAARAGGHRRGGDRHA